jgi:uncharacterized protein YgiM (DUF1202 family)
MFRHVALVAIATSISTISTVVLAQSGLPRPNRQGDYYNGAWNSWLVVDRDRQGLNCRSSAGSNYRVVKKFYNGNKMLVFTQGEDPLIRWDRQEKPWLAVLPTGYQYETPCFVRANSRFIQPIPAE